MSGKSLRMMLLLVVILSFAQVLSAQKKPVGFVLSLDGQWLSDGQPIRRGQELLSGSVLSISPATTMGAGRSVVIVLANGQRITHPCKTPQTCRFTLPASLNSSGTAFSRLADAFNLIFREPDRYASALSRAGRNSTQNLSDAVVKLDARKIDMTPLLQGLAPGRYMLQFRRVPREDSRRGEVSMLSVDWNQKPALAELAPSMGAGLYKVSVFPSARSDAEPIGDEVWILLDTPEHYAESHVGFQEAVVLADSWGREVADSDKRFFLRAVLDRLATDIK